MTSLNVAAARSHKGVVEVMTPANRPKLAQDPDEKTNPFMFRLDLLQNDRVRYANQPIAVVIAESLEAATEGAALLQPQYEAEPARVGLDGNDSFVPPGVGIGSPAETRKGDVEAGLASAATLIDATYETPAQYHNALEPHAIVASWDGETLSIDTPSQGLEMARGRLAGLFGLSPEKIHIRSPFLGGGFGSKGMVSGPQVLGILAARLVGRPVKLVLRRDQMYGPVGHRPPDPPEAAHRRGERRRADARSITTPRRRRARSTISSSPPPTSRTRSTRARPSPRRMKRCGSISVRRCSCGRRAKRPDRSRSKARSTRRPRPAAWTRSQFRLRNYAEVEPISGKPFSSKALRECYAQGAERFGWAGRPLAAAPDARRVRAFSSAGAWARRRFPP